MGEISQWIEKNMDETVTETRNIIHKPVMVKEVISYLNIKPNGTYVDATVGCGGHAREILKRLKDGILICIDWDEEIIKIATKTLSDFNNKIIINDTYTSISEILTRNGIKGVDGILFDLGVSNFHLTSAHRGFSFKLDGPLDMRYNRNINLTAEKVINESTQEELEKIFRNFGQERFSRRIAKKIIKNRKNGRIINTTQLSDVIKRAVPARKWRIHPSTKVFMALRIYVNKELDNLKSGLERCYDVLNPHGRIVVISFHSLEDRIVKEFFRSHSFNILTRKPVRPTLEELLSNPHSRSAKLRAAEKFI